jgi:TolB-like protein/DNA-binding winged helix-turn-helix (wHTH) protein/tetratricopeptide (TPR) repeat protein
LTVSVAFEASLRQYRWQATAGCLAELMARQYEFGEFTLDESRYRLQQGDRVLRLEKRPMELLLLLVERHGDLVTRDEIADKLWGKDIFVDVDHSINTAVRKVRQVLRDDTEEPRYVETVVGKGYRFAAPVVCKNGASISASAAPQASIPTVSEPVVGIDEAKRRPARRSPAIGAFVGLALIAAGAFWYQGRRAKSAVQPAIKSIAVLPLKNLSGDPSQEYLADGMTEELIGRLSSIRDLRVLSRTSVMSFKDTKLGLPEIAKTLKVDAVVEGSVIREGNRIRVHAQLIRAATDEHFWSQEYDRGVQDVLGLQSDIAQAIAEKVEVTITGKERERLVAARPVAPEVYESYLKGMRLADGNTKTEVEQSIAYFEEATEKDPTFAQGYVGLAEAYDRLGYIFVGISPTEVRPKVMRAAQKAIELNPELAGAHAMLADVYQLQWQWTNAEAEYKRALELKPNDADAQLGYASWLICQGRLDEAVAWSRRVGELQPLDSDASVSWILFNARRYDDALSEVRSVLAVHPDSAMAYWVLGFVLIGKAQNEEAISILEKGASMTNRSPGTIGLLATAYAEAGHRSEALKLVNELKQRRLQGYIPAGAFIYPYLALRDYDEAFFWFEEAYKEQSSILQFLKVLPLFDPARGDPRFQDLLRRVGLDQVK